MHRPYVSTFVYVLTQPSAMQCKHVTNCVDMQIQGSVQAKGVDVLANIDKKLEDASLLTKLDTDAEPDEVTDSNSEVTQDCKEVSCD